MSTNEPKPAADVTCPTKTGTPYDPRPEDRDNLSITEIMSPSIPHEWRSAFQFASDEPYIIRGDN
ncbi:MAG: hypothetical protein KW802_02550 [Candidatus Doudnabacteria bacterium]|nr:hypothetical protein [Candidatus Doudnabacteria bacterium]